MLVRHCLVNCNAKDLSIVEQRDKAREVDATNVIYINPGQMRELADRMTNLVEGIGKTTTQTD